MEKPIGTPINSENIEHFLGGEYQQAQGIVTHVADLNGPLDPLENRFAAIIFLPPQEGTIGHFCLLSEVGDHLEWFDSLAQPIPQLVQQYANRRNLKTLYNTTRVQSLTSNTCGKWALARLQSLPTPLHDFIQIFMENKRLSPDEIVDRLIVLKWKQ